MSNSTKMFRFSPSMKFSRVAAVESFIGTWSRNLRPRRALAEYNRNSWCAMSVYSQLIKGQNVHSHLHFEAPPTS